MYATKLKITKKGVKKMEEILQTIIDNIYEIMVGLGLLLTTIFNKNKTPEQIKKSNEKLLAKYEKDQNKDFQRIQNRAKKIDKLKGVNNNVSGT